MKYTSCMIHLHSTSILNKGIQSIRSTGVNKYLFSKHGHGVMKFLWTYYSVYTVLDLGTLPISHTIMTKTYYFCVRHYRIDCLKQRFILTELNSSCFSFNVQEDAEKFLTWPTSLNQYFNDQILEYCFWGVAWMENFSLLPHNFLKSKYLSHWHCFNFLSYWFIFWLSFSLSILVSSLMRCKFFDIYLLHVTVHPVMLYSSLSVDLK